MPQLQINQGPQDALLYDNTRSYFTNVGYVRTSNFQVEYREVQPQNTAAFGSTINFIIPKAADLLGPVDLRLSIPKVTSANLPPSTAQADSFVYQQFVDELGFAMIEKITFSIGSNDIETITGEQLHIRNELMTSDEMRLGHDTILKTGCKAFGADLADQFAPKSGEFPGTLHGGTTATKKVVDRDSTRLIAVQDGNGSGGQHQSDDRHLCVPLGLFFTKHVSQYFPLAAVAGCNDVRIQIKLRSINELTQMAGFLATGTSVTLNYPVIPAIDNCRLFCHYVHVTGPEAQVLMNKEHVRLLKLFQHQTQSFSSVSSGKMEMNLSFLHPVSTLIITIRAEADLNNLTPQFVKDRTAQGDADEFICDAATGSDVPSRLANIDAAGKGFFFYHGDGTNPNYDRAQAIGARDRSNQRNQGTVKLSNIKLTLNGQERHPGLSDGLDVEYLQSRLLPMLHSNSNQTQKQSMGLLGGTDGAGRLAAVSYGQQGSKNIFVYPFSLNPEGSNPSGAVNFSKVSHAQLSLKIATSSTVGAPTKLDGDLPMDTGNLRVDVYALYYNWLQIKDGRALLSFA